MAYERKYKDIPRVPQPRRDWPALMNKMVRHGFSISGLGVQCECSRDHIRAIWHGRSLPRWDVGEALLAIAKLTFQGEQNETDQV